MKMLTLQNKKFWQRPESTKNTPIKKLQRLIVILFVTMFSVSSCNANIIAATTKQGEGGRTIRVNMVVMEQTIKNNRLGAEIPGGQIYVLERDVVPLDHPFDKHGNDINIPVNPKKFKAGEVRLRSYKRPRPIALRINVGDSLEIHFTNLLPLDTVEGLRQAGVQVMGLDWTEDEDGTPIDNGTRIGPDAPNNTFMYRYIASAEGVFMMYSPNGNVINPGDPTNDSQLDYGLFGAVNVQPQEAEWYRSQVTHEDLKLATYKVSKAFMKDYWAENASSVCLKYLRPNKTGLAKGITLRRKQVYRDSKLVCPEVTEYTPAEDLVWQFRIITADHLVKISDILITDEGYLNTKADQPLINYEAMYPKGDIRENSPVLNMLSKHKKRGKEYYELAHTDLTAIITGPDAGRFPYYLNSPTFTENPATPDRRQPYREFTINYHISPNTTQAFEAFDSGPLANTLAAGEDGFAVNYGIAGIAPEIYANRINVGPMGANGDGVDLLFEEFFLSAWAVGDPAILVDTPANVPGRAKKALYPDDPSNVYHSYMRDHVKFRVINSGSVAPHIHHQHAHQWLMTPNSDDSHYLDSQMVNPGSTYTMEMTYNGSGNRNQTVGDSIFHCHIYPHFAQGMWSMWRVHDVFEEGTELDITGKPLPNSRALPDGEIVMGTPIPGLVPLPSLAMAPIPADVRLVDSGRRIKVEPESIDQDGNPVYKNPGFPFFVPGMSGHRAPHPPLDFAWKEKDNKPATYTSKEANANPFRDEGEVHYLDGGLPRHLIIDGELSSEFHTRWDFSKDYSSLIAMELPEEGTAIERAAMNAHATRTHSSYLPDGLPGNFILNGLPPVPGAPFAAPEVDDDGNSTFNLRRYKAAVIQTDVVFNKEGWHYPQQRFITLLDDVKATIEGKKPPEPFFFRANTGETIEFWHTNLVPKDYQLDDFQVRTPTDILGQHIHLVKFDVTSSDGAANGFNYEDGTFSPDEVRARIEAMNVNGGLFHFDPTTQFISDQQSMLSVANYKDDYGNRLGEPPAGQDWNGAQTTIQRFDTDPLLNDKGEDRTLRTVFTHDHYGPTTHQQVGLYGALLVEPAGSKWFDSVTGVQMPNPDPSKRRDDGGPTSWQAIIETNDSKESFREFAIAMGDLQLAYTKKASKKLTPIKTLWFSTINEDYDTSLNTGTVPAGLNNEFAAQGVILGGNITVSATKTSNEWKITRNDVDQFFVTLNGDQLDVKIKRIVTEKKSIYYKKDVNWPLTYANTPEAIWPPTAAQGTYCSDNLAYCVGGLPATCSDNSQATCPSGTVTCTTAGDSPVCNTDNYQPFPTIISDPGGSGNIGTWVANYRSEPLDARIQETTDGNASPDATDPAFAYSSIKRNNKDLNKQPTVYKPLTPGVEPTDPYTPLLRAYANDNIEIRAIVGAVDSIHSFSIKGVNWAAEPTYADSGFRNTQGMGISEHFEFLFRLPPAVSTGKDENSHTDYLYSPSSSNQGAVKGAWGIMRAYADDQGETLAEVKNNPVSELPVSDFYKIPDGANKRVFEVTLEMNENKTCMQYTLEGQQANDCEQVCSVNYGMELICGNNSGLTCNDEAGCKSTATQIDQIIICSNYSDASKPNDSCGITSNYTALILRANAGDWITVNLSNNLTSEDVPQLQTIWAPNNKSQNTSSKNIETYSTSANAGINPMMIAYDVKSHSGLNIGSNPTSTIAPGEQGNFTWYAGNISLDENGQRVLTPVEFGGVNLIPADPLLQQSYGLFGALIIEPAGSTWRLDDNDALSATVTETSGSSFKEIIVIGNNAGSTTAMAGQQVRMRVLNPNVPTVGQVSDSTDLITIEGHGWPQAPYINGATIIGENPLTQWMGTQQITPLESYNLVLPSAGGENKIPGEYNFYYYPKGPDEDNKLGTLNVIPKT